MAFCLFIAQVQRMYPALQCSLIGPFQFTVTFSVGTTGAAQAGFQAKIYPNPSASSAQLSVVLPQEQLLAVMVLDENGKAVFTDKVLAPMGESAIDLPRGLVAGVYWVVVQDVRGNKGVFAWVVQ